MFVNKILHLKSINDKNVVKQNIDEFIYEGDTRTFDVEDIENETEGNDDNGDVEVDDDDNGDDDDSGAGAYNDRNRVDGVTVNGIVSNIKHLIGGACLLKQTILHTVEEITFTFSTTSD